RQGCHNFATGVPARRSGRGDRLGVERRGCLRRIALDFDTRKFRGGRLIERIGSLNRRFLRIRRSGEIRTLLVTPLISTSPVIPSSVYQNHSTLMAKTTIESPNGKERRSGPNRRSTDRRDPEPKTVKGALTTRAGERRK